MPKDNKENDVKTTPKQKYPTFQEMLDLFFGAGSRGGSGFIYDAWSIKSWFESGNPRMFLDDIDKEVKWCQTYGDPDSSRYKIAMLLEKYVKPAIENNADSATRDFLDEFKMVFAARAQATGNMDSDVIKKICTVFVQNVAKMPDGELKYSVLRYVGLYNSYDKNTRIAALKAATQCKSATIYEYDALIRLYPERSPECIAVFGDAEEKLRQILANESKNTLPDIALIQRSVALIRNMAQMTGDRELNSRIKETYDVDKMFQSSLDTTYVANIDASLMNQLAQRDRELQRRNEENDRLKRELEQMRNALQLEKENDEKKFSLIQELRREKDALERELAEVYRQIKELRNEAEEAKASLLSRGVNNMKKRIHDLDVMIRAKENRGK
ncbi:MAG: hypothetical protein J6K82_00160 [Alphaproteobacteria bacterium]|nr:hypothetical protein [Alphaproteobacteria bacterium]